MRVDVIAVLVAGCSGSVAVPPLPRATGGTVVAAIADSERIAGAREMLASGPGLQALVNAVFSNFPPGKFGANAITAAKAGEN